jgi:hypothetical protein
MLAYEILLFKSTRDNLIWEFSLLHTLQLLTNNLNIF